MRKPGEGRTEREGFRKMAVTLPTAQFESVRDRAVRENKTFSQALAMYVAAGQQCLDESDALEPHARN